MATLINSPAGRANPPPYLVEKYAFGRRLGGGAYGDVWLARERVPAGLQGYRSSNGAGCGNKENAGTAGRLVAVKHIKRKYARWEECLKLRECRVLSSLPPHRNCVRLFQLIHAKPQLDLYFVFEYCSRDLHQLTTARRQAQAPFSVAEVAALTFDLIAALQHLHRHGFFHRDIKPENLLVTAAPPAADCSSSSSFSPSAGSVSSSSCSSDLCIGTLKLADFGQTREIRSRPPYTDYVATRWYRAPEVLAGGGQYNSPVDMWAAGCVMGELMTCGSPIFPGQSALQQLSMARLARDPTASSLQAVSAWVPQGVRRVSHSPEALALMRVLLQYDQMARPSATAALRHSFFYGCREERSKPVVSAATAAQAASKAASKVASKAVAAAAADVSTTDDRNDVKKQDGAPSSKGSQTRRWSSKPPSPVALPELSMSSSPPRKDRAGPLQLGAHAPTRFPQVRPHWFGLY